MHSGNFARLSAAAVGRKNAPSGMSVGGAALIMKITAVRQGGENA
jgi:hypothetical protein